jgi:hypothetical protein
MISGLIAFILSGGGQANVSNYLFDIAVPVVLEHTDRSVRIPGRLYIKVLVPEPGGGIRIAAGEEERLYLRSSIVQPNGL